jgi:CBS-domain-containing membrane protein
MQTLRVSDVMTRRVSPISATEEVLVTELNRRFRSFHHLPVIDERRRVVGILTPSDVLNRSARPLARRVRVSELMRAPAIICTDVTPLETAARKMREEGVRALIVVSGPTEQLAGIVTSTDILRAFAGQSTAPEDLDEILVDELMIERPVAVRPQTSVADAARTLAETGVRHLLVVDGGGKLTGLLTERDLIEYLHRDVMSYPDATAEELDAPIAALATPSPTVLRTGTRLRDALGVFADERPTAVPVVDDGGRAVGLISYIEVLRWLRDRSAHRLGPEPEPVVTMGPP